MNNPIIEYATEITVAYDDIVSNKYNKSIIENEQIRIVIYRCGVIVRIDIKDKTRGEYGTCR